MSIFLLLLILLVPVLLLVASGKIEPAKQRTLWDHFLKVINRFPLTVISSFTAFFLSCWLATQAESQRIINLLVVSALGISFSTGLTFVAERRKLGIFSQLVVWAISLSILYFVLQSTFGDRYPIYIAAFFVGAHLFVSVAPFLTGGGSGTFWLYNAVLLTSFLQAVFYSHLIFLLYAGVLATVTALFGINVAGAFYYYSYFLVAFVVTTFIFLAYMPESFEDDDVSPEAYPPGLKVLGTVILIPFTSIYFLILYLYLIKIIFTGKLPSGVTSWLVSFFSFFGLITWLLVFPLRDKAKRFVTLYIRYFFQVLLPVLVLLFISIYERVIAYGITEKRYYLLILALWLAWLAIYYIVTKSRNIKIVPLSLLGLLVLSLFGPWSAFNVSYLSQKARLRDIFLQNSLDPINPRVATDLSSGDSREISSISAYLLNNHGTEALRRFFSGNLRAEEAINKSLSEPINASFGQKYSYVYPKLLPDLLGLYGIKYSFSTYRSAQEYFSLAVDKKSNYRIQDISTLSPTFTIYNSSAAGKRTGEPYLSQGSIFVPAFELEVNLVEFVRSLKEEMKHNSGKSGYRLVPADRMRLAAEAKGKKIVLLLQSIGGYERDGDLEINSLHFSLAY